MKFRPVYFHFMNTHQARLTVLQAQLSHARLGLSAAADNSTLAAVWLAEVQRIERQIAKVAEAPESAAA